MATPTIGILGGMGPRSTAPFVDLVVDECQRQYGATHDVDYPPMMIYSLPTPFYLDRPLDHALLRQAITSGLARLARTGVAFVAMPCNTAHIYYDHLSSSVDIPLLNMVEAAMCALPPLATRVALLATRATADAGLYQSALASQGRSSMADEALQRLVDRLITSIKASGDGADSRHQWQALLSQLRGRGADAALIACTDLNVVSHTYQGDVQLVDVTGQLAVATVAMWRELAGRLEL